MASQSAKLKQTKLSLQMREILGRAYSFVRGQEYTDSMANITYEELLEAAIDRIEGTKGRSEVRATKLDRVKAIKQEIGQAVDTVTKVSPSQWALMADERVSKKDAMNTKETA
jgi:hypothetical protein